MAASPDTPMSRPSRRLVALLVVVVVAIAIGGYAFTGSPSLAGLGAPPPPPPTAAAAPSQNDRDKAVAQIADMVDRLAARLKEKPDDAEGWSMLARSYTVLGRMPEALPAYRRAIALDPRSAGLLADYADAMIAANDGKTTDEAIGLVDRSLAMDGRQPKALALAGTFAFDRGDYAKAVADWQKIAEQLPPESEFHQQVVANIDEARRRGNLPVANAANAAVASGAEALTGTVMLSPQLAAQAAPDDTVFVYAHAEAGRMPLAVVRAKVKDLPLKFRLDDSMAMTASMKLSDMHHVIVAARVSKTGNAITQPGDLIGETPPIPPGTKDIAITIASPVGAK
jgi:cytochrome c-type biogenesis protein CcmH